MTVDQDLESENLREISGLYAKPPSVVVRLCSRALFAFAFALRLVPTHPRIVDIPHGLRDTAK